MAGSASRPAVFLDRDGTLNHSVVRDGLPYAPTRREDFRLIDDAASACRTLAGAGYILVVATNQPDVGRGTMARHEVEAMHAQLQTFIPEISRIEACYAPGKGVPDPDNRRRKPEPGMLLDSAAALGLDLNRSWMIGDRWRDVDCGLRAGVRTIFIDQGYSEELRQPPDFTVATLTEAAAIVLAHPRF